MEYNKDLVLVFNMELVYKNSNEELEQIEYPIYLIKSIEPKRDKEKEV